MHICGDEIVLFSKGRLGGMNFQWAAQLTCGVAASSTPALCKGASPLRLI